MRNRKNIRSTVCFVYDKLVFTFILMCQIARKNLLIPIAVTQAMTDVCKANDEQIECESLAMETPTFFSFYFSLQIKISSILFRYFKTVVHLFYSNKKFIIIFILFCLIWLIIQNITRFMAWNITNVSLYHKLVFLMIFSYLII